MPATKAVRTEKVIRGGAKNGEVIQKPAAGTTSTGSKVRAGRKSSFLSKAHANVSATIRSFGDIISLGDVANVFGVTSQTVRKWVADGYLPEGFFPEGYTDRKLYVKTSDVAFKINAAITAPAV